MKSDNPEDLNLLFYDFNQPSKPNKRKSRKMKRTSQILEATEENEDDEDYSIDRQFPEICNMDHIENSFDKRKNTDSLGLSPPMHADDIIRGMRGKETPMSSKYFVKPKDVGHSTMINWAKKDRLPTRGIHTRGGRRHEQRAK